MNRENLKKLADYLSAGNTGMVFSMHDYCTSGDNDYDVDYYDPFKYTCGAVGCAVGHGPYAGIPVGVNDHTWDMYCERVFGVDEDEWDWCFSSMWRFVDNTPQGAAKRIYFMLERGVPANFVEQMQGIGYVFAEKELMIDA